MGPAAHSWTICVLSLNLLPLCREDARKGRCAGGDHAHPQALLLPGCHRASVLGTITAQLSFLLSILLLNMMHDATDRFMRDTICCATVRSGSLFSTTRCMIIGQRSVGIPYFGCFGPGRRLLTIGGGLASWVSSCASKCCTLRYNVPDRDKEEVENWRQRIRHPSVPVRSFQFAPQQVSCLDNGFDLSISSFPLLCLSPDSRMLYPSIADSTASIPPLNLLFHQHGPCLQGRERSRTPTQPPLSKRHSLPNSTSAPLFFLINHFSKCLF